MDKPRIEAAVREILAAIGDDPDREGLRETPRRVASMYEEIFAGLNHPLKEEELTIFTQDRHEEMVLVKDIPLYSMCEHHLLPFYGKAHVAYIPKDGRIIGLSKLARIVDNFSRKPQLQERLTSEIADFITEMLDPQGVGVMLEAEHLCMTMRGIKKAGSITQTSALRGSFRRDARTRAEFFSMLGF